MENLLSSGFVESKSTSDRQECLPHKTKKPAALSPSLAGSQRIGGREAADSLTSDRLQFVDDVDSTNSGSLSAVRLFISSRRSFNRRNFKRLNFARVAFAARNCSFQFVSLPISTPLKARRRC